MRHWMKRMGWIAPFIMVTLILSGCGGSSGTSSDSNTSSPYHYKGLQFYYDPMPPTDYHLTPLSDATFNALSDEEKIRVAHTLLSSLFYGMPLSDLTAKIDQGDFLSALRSDLETSVTDVGWLESHILDDSIFKQYTQRWYQPQTLTILRRLYAMRHLDQYYLHNWIAYILTQTILFSPANELSTTHTPNIANVYNRLVTMLGTGAGMRYITYVHMSSEDNWRRFRSPEDNGREMLEIYLRDANDTHVPLAGKALQNWKLNTDSDTLEVGLNRNTTPLSLFGTTVYTGDDFYREMVKSDAFVSGVTGRLVAFFFPDKNATERTAIEEKIVASHPETWQDIVLQILFSETYLLHNTRPQSAEETFYSLARRMGYRTRRGFFADFRSRLEKMHQASMKYKLGKLDRVPLDTLSFGYYHQMIREDVLIRPTKASITDHNSWSYTGWQASFLGWDRFDHDETDPAGSLDHLVDYLFLSVIGRRAASDERALFHSHILTTQDGRTVFKDAFNMFTRRDNPDEETKQRTQHKNEIAILVLDYLSRLRETYTQNEVK